MLTVWYIVKGINPPVTISIYHSLWFINYIYTHRIVYFKQFTGWVDPVVTHTTDKIFGLALSIPEPWTKGFVGWRDVIEQSDDSILLSNNSVKGPCAS